MAEKQYWLGSVGPLLYDDTDVYGDDPSLSFLGGRFEGQIQVETTPSADMHVVRLQDLTGVVQAVSVTDIDDPSTELASLYGDADGALLIAYEEANPDLSTIYVWDAGAGSANTPLRVAGTGGYWIAIAGVYANSRIKFADYVKIGGVLYIVDSNTHIWRDGSGNLRLGDTNVGNRNLIQLDRALVQAAEPGTTWPGMIWVDTV